MSLLKTEPEGVVRSLSELMAIAKAMENEAAQRYRQLVKRMHNIGNKACEEVFAHLAHEEEKHAVRVTELSQAVIGAPPSAADIRWELPQDLEDEAMSDLAASKLVTPYRALSIAVRNEERAFAFWSYVSAYSPNEVVREYAEKMAREELRHASILREERRRAYHAREGSGRRSARNWSLEDIEKQAAASETKILDSCWMSSAAASGDPETARTLTRVGDECRINMRALGGGRAELSAEGSPENLPPLAVLDRALAATEAAAEAYMQAAEWAKNEDVVLIAQQLAGSAITRLVALRERRARLVPVEFEVEP
jgi:rubrerythrin